MGSYFSRRSKRDLTGPVKYMHDNYGNASLRFVAPWVKITRDDGLLRFPQNGTFDRTKLENLREKLSTLPDRNKHFSSLKLWRDESNRRNAESQIASLTDQNKKLMAQLEEEKKNTTQTETKPDSQLDMSYRNTKTNKNDQTKSLYPVREIKESSDDSTDDDWVFEYPRNAMNNQGKEERILRQSRRTKKTDPEKLAPLITMGKDLVYKPWSRRELKAIVGDFPKDVRTNKQKWLEEWDSVCTIYSPHMPDMMQLLKLTLPSDLKDKVIDTCEIPRNPTEFAKITPEEAQTFYSVIALAVQQEVIQQVDFSPLTKIKQGKDDNPRELYGKMMTTAKETCGLSLSQINGFPPGYMQNLFVNSLQQKIRAKVQLTIGWSGKPMTELVEIAQHHWDNTELRECRMQEMLMVAQVSHYTGGATRGGRSGRGRFQKERGHQRRRPPHHGQGHKPPFSHHENCFLCGEADHWVSHCPYKASQHTLPTAPPSNQIEEPPTPQYNQ